MNYLLIFSCEIINGRLIPYIQRIQAKTLIKYDTIHFKLFSVGSVSFTKRIFVDVTFFFYNGPLNTIIDNKLAPFSKFEAAINKQLKLTGISLLMLKDRATRKKSSIRNVRPFSIELNTKRRNNFQERDIMAIRFVKGILKIMYPV